MRTLTEIQEALAGCKGDGRWRRIAELSGCSYDTLARIKRGAIASPGMVLCEKIDAAIDATAAPVEPEKAGA